MDTKNMDPGPERPYWNPEQNFPLDVDKASVEDLLGALLATIEHQQVRTLKMLDATVADRYLRNVMSSPAVHLPRVMALAHHHEARGRQRGRGRTQGRIIDWILGALPEELPRFVPALRRWRTVRSYRLVRAHLDDTFAKFFGDYAVWKDLQEARGLAVVDDPDVAALMDEEAGDGEVGETGDGGAA